MSVTVATWATERVVARARKLWDAGERTADIGHAVGVSRDTIVGYARRHHWPPHPHPPRGGSPPGVSKPRKPLELQQQASLARKAPKPAPKSPPAVAAPVARPGVAYCAAHFPRCYHRPPRWAYGAVA